MVRPWAMMTMSSARWSASSRYWVVSTTLVPSATRLRIASHKSIRLRGSRPVVGSRPAVAGGADRSRSQIQLGAHAAGLGAHESVGVVFEAHLDEHARRVSPR